MSLERAGTPNRLKLSHDRNNTVRYPRIFTWTLTVPAKALKGEHSLRQVNWAQIMEIQNAYAAADYAQAYSALDWGGTYHLVFRELPGILAKHSKGPSALDFGCGAGRSTRLLRALGFSCVGIDISEAMIAKARELDSETPYHVVRGSDFTALGSDKFDVVLACFPFDNIEGDDFKLDLMQALHKRLAPGGILINIVSSEELYHNEWVSFTTERFPENKIAKPGDVVRTVTRTFAGSPVCDDILCDNATYRKLYQKAGFSEIACYRPLGREDDGMVWKSEAEIAPWVIWVLAKGERTSLTC